MGLVLSFSQVPEVNARWKVPMVVENVFMNTEQQKEEALEDDSLVVRGRVTGYLSLEVIGALVELRKDNVVVGRNITDNDGRFKISIHQSTTFPLYLRVIYNKPASNEVLLRANDVLINQNNVSSYFKVQLEEIVNLENCTFSIGMITREIFEMDPPGTTILSGDQIDRIPNR